MSRRRTALTHISMLTVTAIAGGRGAWAADWSETLEASLLSGYVTNVQLLPDSHRPDEMAAVTVDGKTTAQTETATFTLTPRLSLTRYLHETELDNYSGGLDFTYQDKLERGQWNIGGGAVTDSTLTSELGQTGISYVNLRHNAGNLSVGGQYSQTEQLAWQLQVAGQVTRYADATKYNLTNYDYGTVAGGPILSFSERLQGLLTFEADRIDPKTGTAQEQYSESLELRRSLSERYSWRASAGITHVDAGPAGTQNREIFEIEGSRQGERLQLDLDIRRAVLPIGLGLLARQDQALVSMAYSTSEHGTLAVAATYIRSDPVLYYSYVVYTGAAWVQASAEYRYQLTQHLSASLGGQYSRARNGDPATWADSSQAHLALTWQSPRL